MTTSKRVKSRRRTLLIAAVLAGGAAVSGAQQKGSASAQNAAGAAQMQQQQMVAVQAKMFAEGQVAGSTPNPRQGANSSPFPSNGGDETSPFLQDAVRMKRNDERQRKLENDTRRLLTLANQLRSEVAVSGAEAMTPEMLRQMDEIEKLAKSVKDRMRN